MSGVALVLEGAAQRFGDFSLDIELVVPRGEYLVILGPSGCGKSLLLGTIAGLHPVAAGRVLIDGVDATAAPPERRHVGMVFQGLSLFPHLDVLDNVVFGLRLRRVPAARRRARADELVATLGLEPLLGRPTPTLSGGEAQRVALARALAPEPALLLLDEPLSLLDHNARLALQQQLRRVHESLALTTLHVTHNREEARALADRCAVMCAGRIVQVGPVDEVFSRPRCAFVARFVGADPATARVDPAACNEVCLDGLRPCGHDLEDPRATAREEQVEGGPPLRH